MSASILVQRRFNGPPTSAHGGYVCGLIAAATGANVRVRLLKPPALETEYAVIAQSDDEWTVENGADTVATAMRTECHAHVPSAPTYVQAMDASLHFPGFTTALFAECFVCGHHRQKPDGLRIFAGPVPGGLSYAAPWVPGVDLTGADGKVKPEFIWSVLDCPGFFASFTDLRMALLGEFCVHIDRLVHADEACVVIGWPIMVEGRKHKVGTALFDEDGERCAVGVATWIEVKQSN